MSDEKTPITRPDGAPVDSTDGVTVVREQAPEHWALQHPVFGLIEVFVGTASQLVTVDPGFPEDKVAREVEKANRASSKKATGAIGDKEMGSSSEVPAASSGELKGAGSGSALDMFSKNLVVKVAGVVIARRDSLGNVKIGLKENPKPIKDGKFDYPVATGAPYIELESNFLGKWLRTVRVKARGKLIEFDAPAGSKAEQRQKAMEASPFKRWFYPLMVGMGKGGWALFCLVVIPLLANVLRPLWEWLSQFFPDWDINIPWPEINLPQIPLPELILPSIPWPYINLPSINLPDWTAPGWLEFVLEYNKVWVPIVIGIGVGIVAVRNSRRSRETKLQWERERLAAAMAARVRQLEQNSESSAP